MATSGSRRGGPGLAPMPLEVELGKASQHRCGCCGKLSHVLRGGVSRGGSAHAVYMAGYTENHAPKEGTVLVSIGSSSQGATLADRAAVVMKVRRISGRFQVMIVGSEGCPWDDAGALGPIQTRAAALARPDVQEYFHVVDHVLELDDRFTRGFS